MHTIRASSLAIVGILGLAACERDAPPPPPPPRPAVLFLVPKVERSIVVDTTGTPEVERATLVARVSGDSVARFYRARLPQLNWYLRNERTDGPVTNLYLEGGPIGGSLWVQIERQDSASARYTLIARGGRMPAPARDTVARP